MVPLSDTMRGAGAAAAASVIRSKAPKTRRLFNLVNNLFITKCLLK
jgi:hypothetical protein